MVGARPAGTSSAIRPSLITTPRSAASARMLRGSLIQSAELLCNCCSFPRREVWCSANCEPESIAEAPACLRTDWDQTGLTVEALFACENDVFDQGINLIGPAIAAE